MSGFGGTAGVAYTSMRTESHPNLTFKLLIAARGLSGERTSLPTERASTDTCYVIRTVRPEAQIAALQRHIQTSLSRRM